MRETKDIAHLPIAIRVRFNLLQELHATIFSTLLSLGVATATSATTAWYSNRQIDWIILIAIVGASLCRVKTLLSGRYILSTRSISLGILCIVDCCYSTAYLFYAACMGAFAARMATLEPAGTDVIAVCIAGGYCAGAAFLVGIHSRLAVIAITLAIAPAVIVFLVSVNVYHRLAGVLMIALWIAGIITVRRYARRAALEIGGRLNWQLLSWRDPLTGLWN